MGNQVYRLTTPRSDGEIPCHQYLLVDELSALISLGTIQMVDEVRESLPIPVSRLTYVVTPHFEGDECGGLARLLELAPQVVPVCSHTCARQLFRFGICHSSLIVSDGDRLDLGALRLRFIATPHVHQWDSILTYEETMGILFSSDLFMQRKDTWGLPPEALMAEVVEVARGIMPSPRALGQALEKIQELDIKVIAPGHGRLLTSNVESYVSALKDVAKS